MAIVNEEIVLKFYLEELDNENISFLKGRDYLKDNIRNDIEELIKADGMHEKIGIAKSLWKSLFTAGMSYIDKDRRGYDVLFKFFDDYVDFEELIFASDSFYRDHTLHCLWVYFLGEYLYRNDEYNDLFKDKDKYLKSFLTIKNDIESLEKVDDFEDILGNYQDIEKFIDKEEASRCIAALCHDLGYPLKKISQINTSIRKILPIFYIKDISEFNFTFTELEHIYIKKFIQFLSLSIGFIQKEVPVECQGVLRLNCNSINSCGLNKAFIDTAPKEERLKIKDYLTLDVNAKENLNKFLSYSRNFEEYYHGILSAFLLTKNVKAFENLNFSFGEGNNYFEHIDYSDVATKQEILRAMTEHTNDNFRIREISSNVELLSIIDELEEFSRISRANKNREYVEQYCKTDLYFKDGWLNINLIFDNDNIGEFKPELAFKFRCKRFLDLIDIQNLSENLKIRIKFTVKMQEDREYILEMGREYANIIIDNNEVIIPDYLNSYEYCTKKQYMNRKK